MIIDRKSGVLGPNGIIDQASLHALKTIRSVVIAGRFLAGPAVIGFQTLRWLQTGQWRNIGLRTWPAEGQVLRPSRFEWWLYDPHSWYGLHVIAKFLLFDLPVWVWLIAFFYVAQFLIQDTEREWTFLAKANVGKR